MEAGTINCPMCGAATSTDSPQCRYCEAKLATVGCPSCFAMMFIGSKHCPRCGAAAARQEIDSDGKKCPRCKTEMRLVAIGDSKVLECESCLGLWLDTQSFERVCADQEQHAAVLGKASISSLDSSTLQSKVNYIPCPQCSQLMNRANFARCSGVIIDICKQHGVWFDQNELSRIVEFIRAGGLDQSRAKEKRALEEERRQLQLDRVNQQSQRSGLLGVVDSDRASGIASAGDLLKMLLG
jgi:Zn-finger nucleic acid-binding protein